MPFSITTASLNNQPFQPRRIGANCVRGTSTKSPVFTVLKFTVFIACPFCVVCAIFPLPALATIRDCSGIPHLYSCRSFQHCTQHKIFLEMHDPTARLKLEGFLEIRPAFRGFLSTCRISSFCPPIRSPAVLCLRYISHYPQLWFFPALILYR